MCSQVKILPHSRGFRSEAGCHIRAVGWLLVIVAVAGCERAGCAQADPAPVEPALVEPADFASWPRVTEKPVRVGPLLWMLCRDPTPAEAIARDKAAKPHGPHAGYSIVVRVSPEAVAAFRSGDGLPAGAVVVKEKYTDELASGPMQAYAVMVKRAPGFDPGAGDWEFEFVTLAPERSVARGRLAECASCHARARDTDYLFRSYGEAGR